MPYNEQLAQRVRDLLVDQSDEVREQKMFGGIAFMLRGNMAVGVHSENLIVRVEPAETDALLAKPHVRIFDLSGGRPMKGWLIVGAAGVKTKRSLKDWVARGAVFARSLPPK